MSKVRPIRKAVAPAPVAPAPAAVQAPAPEVVKVPVPLTDAESMMLRHLCKLRDQATNNISEFVNFVLGVRGFQSIDEQKQPTWAISLGDFKTIVPAVKPAAPAAPAPQPNA